MKALNDMDNRLQGIEGLLTQQQRREPVATSRPTGNPELTRPAKTPESSTSTQTWMHASPTEEIPGSNWGLGPLSNGTFGGIDWNSWIQIHQNNAFPNASSHANLQESPEHVSVFPDMELDGSNALNLQESVFLAQEPLSLPFDNQDTFHSTHQGEASGSQSLPQTNIHSDTHEQVLQDSDDDITHQLANRFGRLQLAEDGQLRYYGATSHLHMMSQESVSFYQPSSCHMRDEGDAAVDIAGLQWTPDADYESHLTRLLIAWHNPWVNEVDQQIYHREKIVYDSGRDTPLYTPALSSAILAMGAFYSKQDHSGIEERPSDFFAARTRIYLEIEMDSPALATTQAVMILSAHEAANGRDSRAWIYSGMAVQMATDLGLHLNMKMDGKYLDVSTDIESVIALRNKIFWVVYTSNTFHSTYNGRPGLMNRLHYTTPTPPPRSSYDWEPYSDTDEQIPLPSGLKMDNTGMISTYVPQLAMKMVRITELLYSGVPSSLRNVNTFVSAISKEMEQWRADIPTALQLSAEIVPLPMVYQLQ
ncbi:hypothetical protein LTR66_000315 [Elasticomyces elasticus]|nr:hypothetical protein LTR66_000315 [Elasticomyces elasticus]